DAVAQEASDDASTAGFGRRVFEPGTEEKPAPSPKKKRPKRRRAPLHMPVPLRQASRPKTQML
ncbi:MAG: hypothetical protein ACO2ZX_13735, partial [Paracoccaceae bacterium]